MSSVPLTSLNAPFDAAGFESVKADLQMLALQDEVAAYLHLSGPNRVLVPLAGSAFVYAVTDTATASSGAGDNHVLKCLRSGQDESGLSQSSVNAEYIAYREMYLGRFDVGQGDVLKLSLTVTGAPSPTLTADNFTMRVALRPRR